MLSYFALFGLLRVDAPNGNQAPLHAPAFRLGRCSQVRDTRAGQPADVKPPLPQKRRALQARWPGCFDCGYSGRPGGHARHIGYGCLA